MNSQVLAIVTGWLFFALLDLQVACAADDRPAADADEVKVQRAANMKAMKELAGKVQVTLPDQPDVKSLPLIAEALFRYDDQTREMNDGSMWASGRTGRPAMLLTLAGYRAPSGAKSWIVEWNSLADGKIATKGLSAPFTPSKPGLEFKTIADAPGHGKNPQARSREMKDLAHRFAGFEYFSGNPYELRLLSQPIHRYSNPEQGLVDGALFVFTHNLNPEVVLVIEASKMGEKETWSYGFTRVAYAELRMNMDDKEIWKVPQLKGGDVGPNDPYWLSWLAAE